MKDMLKIIAVSALATAAVIKAVPAFSEPALAQNVAIVHTADLDLSTVSGRATLEHRLVTAAYEVCQSASDADLAGKNKVRECRADVLAKAHAQEQRLASSGGLVVAAAR
ncbi:MAG TPA: UrcA family protein [Sphingomicrobium sp.]|nr:UrcA family protein [Sphingomicrobium sp.]